MRPADALFTKTQQRVLGLLYGNPSRSFYSNEIVRLSGVGIGTVHRELARLHASGLATAGLIGNQKHYQANRAAPVFGMVCAKHKDLPKAEIKKHREQRRAQKAKAKAKARR